MGGTVLCFTALLKEHELLMNIGSCFLLQQSLIWFRVCNYMFPYSYNVKKSGQFNYNSRFQAHDKCTMYVFV